MPHREQLGGRGCECPIDVYTRGCKRNCRATPGDCPSHRIGGNRMSRIALVLALAACGDPEPANPGGAPDLGTSGCGNRRCAPVAIVSGQDNPIALALDETSVYWANFAEAGTIM